MILERLKLLGVLGLALSCPRAGGASLRKLNVTKAWPWPDDPLQQKPPAAEHLPNHRDLAFVHIPFNLGNTLEAVATFGKGPDALKKFGMTFTFNQRPDADYFAKWAYTKTMLGDRLQTMPQMWGPVNPDLAAISSAGCNTFVTPPKFWPSGVAQAYFRNLTRFTIMRDPYERFVSIFRTFSAHNGEMFGGFFAPYAKNCDANGAINAMLDRAMINKYDHGCAYIPQSEYFEGEYGAQVIVDGRKFPYSLNSVLRDHHYDEMIIQPEDCMHVTGCSEVWAGSLTPGTKARIRAYYAKDFEILCATFGYCNYDENTCLENVPTMCPRALTKIKDEQIQSAVTGVEAPAAAAPFP